MNRHGRRAARAKSFTDLVLAWPEVSGASITAHAGKVIHAVCRHDATCPAITTGCGILACRCTPQISYHVEPTIQ